ncbi:MAG: HNH endonuclease signature motif containing protein [Nitrososphaeraceae archaeon]
MSANNPPLQIQKQLKKEASYGCVICGCPILQYAHIVPNGDVQAFLPENMLVLCPFHYIRYNDREVSESALREAKNNPYNKMHEQYAFTVISQQDVSVNIGKCKFVNTPRLLVIDDFDIFSIKREDGKYILLDINFFDKLNSLIAIVSENSWTAEQMNRDWSINYKPKHLTIKNQSKNIIFEAKIQGINSNEINITADGMHYNRSPIKITENQILLNGEEIAVDLKGTELRNYEAGIVAETAW